MSIRKFYTTRLFARSSFISGLGTIFNIAGKFYRYNYSKSPEEADRKALISDWFAVGDDMRKAIEIQRKKKNFNVSSPNSKREFTYKK